MKKLILIRHAKSDWGDPSLKDFDRPLNDRGKRDAPMMAKRLHDREIKIDALVSSPAKRARKTAEAFAKEYRLSKESIVFENELYLAESPVFARIISRMKDDHNCIAVFSHNPGITDFANTLSDARIDSIPTCGVFAVNLPVQSWKDFRLEGNEFWFVDYPKAGADNF